METANHSLIHKYRYYVELYKLGVQGC